MYFSVVDVIEILTGTGRSRKYWNDLKKKLKKEGSKLSEKIGQLKMESPDGKMRETDVSNTEQLFVLSIPSPHPKQNHLNNGLQKLVMKECRK